MGTLRYAEAINVKNWLLEKVSFNEFKVRSTFKWLLDYSSSSVYVEIKEWFITNFGSIPRLLRVFFNPTKYIAYILHDNLYWEWLVIYSTPEKEEVWSVTRKEADEILREAIKVEQRKHKYYKFLSPLLSIERWLIYLGVRIWGSRYYEKWKE